MISIWRLGGVAAAGALAAGVVLFGALPVGNADELSDLRANNQLLQQRLDQLAQVGPAHPLLPPGSTSFAGSFPRSFLIPGTDTSIEIGGQVDFDATEWFHGGNPNIANASNSSGYGNATITGLPLNGSAASKRSEDVFYQNVQNSRLFFETRTPTAWGTAKTHVEFDFADCSAGGGANANDCSNLTGAVNPLLPRLRLAYATLGPWLFGQNWGIGTDLAAAPESFNSTGIVGTWGAGRIPQASYTWQLPNAGADLEVGLMMAVSSAATADGFIQNDSAGAGTAAALGTNCSDCDAWITNPLKNEWPAPAFALTFHQPWGHLQFHGSFSEIYLDDGAGLNRSYLGGGGGVSGHVMTWGKDNFGFNAHAGQGDRSTAGDGSPSSYLPNLVTDYGGPGSGCYGAVTAAALGTTLANPTGCTTVGHNPSLVHVQLPSDWGAEVNYQHWWTPTLRTNVNIGYEYEDINAALTGINSATAGYNKSEMLGQASLIWSPVPFVNTGFEFFYGQRKTVTNAYGYATGLDYSFVMKF